MSITQVWRVIQLVGEETLRLWDLLPLWRKLDSPWGDSKLVQLVPSFLPLSCDKPLHILLQIECHIWQVKHTTYMYIFHDLCCLKTGTAGTFLWWDICSSLCKHTPASCMQCMTSRPLVRCGSLIVHAIFEYNTAIIFYSWHLPFSPLSLCKHTPAKWMSYDE